MNTFNFSSPTLRPRDDKLVKEIRSQEAQSKSGSVTYSQKSASNYVRAYQEGKIQEVIRDLKK